MLFCYYLINISKMNESSDNEKESQEVLLTSNSDFAKPNLLANNAGKWNFYYR